MAQSAPAFIVHEDERTRSGTLRVRRLREVSAILLNGGFAVLPSDTAYSVAAITLTMPIRSDINELLGRGSMPLSQAFASMPAVRAWIRPNPVAERLLEHFCPGPITVVCGATQHVPAQFIEDGVHGPNLTVGVRIPDSIIERDVSAAVGYPISTVPVRDLSSGLTEPPVITSYSQTMDVIQERIGLIGNRPWCVVEGGEFHYETNSTVIRVADDGAIEILREGPMPREEIEAVAHGDRAL
jgi:L-threonylcarbamoyladenylate synthase